MSRGHQYIGRVGALAIALGIGGLIVALPVEAGADTGAGSPGNTTSSSSAGPKARSATAGPGKDSQSSRAGVNGPVVTVSTAHSVRAARRVPLGGSGNPAAPAATPLELAGLALRRESSSSSAAVVSVATVSSGEPAKPASALPAAATDMTYWNSNVAPKLTTFIKNGINYGGLSNSDKAVADAVLSAVVEVMGNAYTKSPVNNALTNLGSNQTFLTFVANQIQTGLIDNGLTAEAAHVAGQAAGYLTQNLLGNTNFQNAIGALVQTLTVVPDNSLDALLQNIASPGYELGDLVQQDVQQSAPAFVTGVPVLIANQGLRAAVFSTIKGAAHVLVGLDKWQDANPSSSFVHFIGDQVELAVGQGPNTSPVTAVVAVAGRGLVERVLGSAAVIDGALGTVQTTVSTFLDYPGVGAALQTAVAPIAQAFAAGNGELEAAFDTATQGLRANASIHLALGQALRGGVKSLAADAAMLNAISASAKTFLTDVATDPVIKAAVIVQFGAKYGGEIVGVLNNTAAVEKLAGAITSAVPKFLRAGGVADVLGDALNQIAVAGLNSENPNDVIQGVLAALQVNPTIKAALRSSVSAAVRGFLGVQTLERAATKIVGLAIHDFFDSSPFANSAVQRLAVNALKSVVYSLMGDGSVRTLLGDLAGDLATGRAPAAVVRAFINGVLSSPGAQLAAGMAVGQAVGSLFGGGIIGSLVAPLVGIPTGLFIVVNALPVLLFVRSGLADALIGQLTSFLPTQTAEA